MAGKIITDTSDFCLIDKNDSIFLGDREFIITGNAKERRFGVEDPKLWVKWVNAVETGEKKILKLVFFETFLTSLGGVEIQCFRNPEKEGEILEVVKEHPHFMHGEIFRDDKGNNIRLIDIVRGPNFYVYLESIRMGHKEYFFNLLPGILKKIIKAFEAIRYLHLNGYKHGDVRNDHVIIENTTGNYVWIDFDYDYEATENPFGLDLFGMGNIILYALGKGFHTLHTIKYDTRKYGDLFEQLTVEDLSILDHSRVMNLKKIFPYIPKQLNDILLHFSKGTEIYYETADEIIEELTRCIYSVF